jgi:hypothetical protein
MKLNRKTSYALLAFGVWSWIIWVTFIKNIWNDSRSFSHGSPTSFLTVHLVLTAASIVFGTAIGALGWRGVRASRR